MKVADFVDAVEEWIMGESREDRIREKIRKFNRSWNRLPHSFRKVAARSEAVVRIQMLKDERERLMMAYERRLKSIDRQIRALENKLLRDTTFPGMKKEEGETGS